MTPCIYSKYMPGRCGYCRVRYGVGTGRKPRVLHHRLVFALYYGLDPYNFEGVVMHACDNRRCINIEHLSLGTHKDNTQDMLKKGRCGTTVLSQADVQYIRANFQYGQRGLAKAIAERLGIKRNQVYRVFRGEQHTWIQL